MNPNKLDVVQRQLSTIVPLLGDLQRERGLITLQLLQNVCLEKGNKRALQMFRGR